MADAALRQLSLRPVADGWVGEVNPPDRRDVVDGLDPLHLRRDVEVPAGLLDQVGDAPRGEAVGPKLLGALAGVNGVDALVAHLLQSA